MISGRVNDIYEAVISVEVAAYDRQAVHRFDAVIDTGFSPISDDASGSH